MSDSIKTNWVGSFYDGKTAAREEVKVVLQFDSLQIIRKDSSPIVWNYSEIVQTQGFHVGEPVYLQNGRDSLEALVFKNDDIIDSLKHIAPDFNKNFKKHISRSKLFVLAAVALVGSMIIIPILYFWIVPFVSDRAAMNVPVEWEEMIGESYVDQLVSLSDECNDKERKAKLEGLLALLTDELDDSRYKYTLTVAQGSMINAFALPGGYVVVYQGLLEKTKRPEELLGVLAHEVQHVEHRHGMKSLFRGYTIDLLVAAITGDSQGLGNVIDMAGLLGVLGYTRKDEVTADTQGLVLIRKARIDPTGMVDFFKIIQNEYGKYEFDIDYLSTHPRTADRIKSLERMIEQNKPEYTVSLEDYDWDKIKMICRGQESRYSEQGD